MPTNLPSEMKNTKSQPPLAATSGIPVQILNQSSGPYCSGRNPTQQAKNHALFVYQRNCTSSKTRTQKASTEEMRWPNDAHTSGPTNFQLISHREAIGGGPGAPSRPPVPATPLPRWPCDCCAVCCVLGPRRNYTADWSKRQSVTILRVKRRVGQVCSPVCLKLFISAIYT